MARGRKTGGRKSKLTPELQEKVLAAIRAGNYASVAAQYAGISISAFYHWLQRGSRENKGIYREFLDAIKSAESAAEVRAVAMIQQHMGDNWQAAMTYLERRAPDRWGRRDRIKVEIEPRKVLATLLNLNEEEIQDAVNLAAVRFNKDEST